MANIICEAQKALRQSAVNAALRNINIHVFGGKASEKVVIEYVAGRLRLQPTDIKLWQVSNGVPKPYVADFLVILNEHSVWRMHQLRPTRHIAAHYVGAVA
ncbi:hypothetical protein [Vibrio sp. ER1A]|uniref:hypothetical protein n=1 Tax=Vibrio sp. ER1A TaxID=1517681 RepID=UPI0004DD035A|nr:hypothetical protein [Vibrio sp. ER1A]KFA98762.1 hypothetical protein HW45_06975 [Vibrio sp. ER1A]